MAKLPSGAVTFLFSDIEGSIALWERDRTAMRAAVARQLAILESTSEAHHGVLFKTIGDGTQAAFASAEDGLLAAFDAQRALLAEAWPDSPGPLRVRMALHAGEAAPDAHGDYLAAPLNRLARLLAAGHGGQVLVSMATQELARDARPAGVGLRDLGEHPLRDLARPERIFQLLHSNLRSDFPPIRTLASRSNNLPLQPTPFVELIILNCCGPLITGTAVLATLGSIVGRRGLPSPRNATSPGNEAPEPVGGRLSSRDRHRLEGQRGCGE